MTLDFARKVKRRARLRRRQSSTVGRPKRLPLAFCRFLPSLSLPRGGVRELKRSCTPSLPNFFPPSTGFSCYFFPNFTVFYCLVTEFGFSEFVSGFWGFPTNSMIIITNLLLLLTEFTEFFHRLPGFLFFPNFTVFYCLGTEFGFPTNSIRFDRVFRQIWSLAELLVGPHRSANLLAQSSFSSLPRTVPFYGQGFVICLMGSSLAGGDLAGRTICDGRRFDFLGDSRSIVRNADEADEPVGQTSH